ncbi:MAG: hypothetical protein M3451_03740 [Chloroflexota bacterium]|jgi:hypothetical protein|nr:hypothetical protein [Chloroflexota bacterium]
MIESRVITLLVSMLAVMSLSIAAASAQDATPDAEGGMTHPAHIHEGTCEELDPNPAFPLDNLMQIEDSMVAYSMTTVEVSVEDALAAPHAINVHESPENAANYVACGNIEGPVVDGTLVIGLNQQNDSGIAGVAVLEANDDGGTDVSVYVVYGLAD